MNVISKLDNGSTLIVLGEGTVYTTNVYTGEENIPVGIAFLNDKEAKELTPESIVIQITNKEAVTSYVMSLLRLLETWDKEKASNIAVMMEALAPYMPTERVLKEVSE